MEETTSAGGLNRLERLSALLSAHQSALPLLRRSGRLTEVTASHLEITGLGPGIELGAIVRIDDQRGSSLAEIIAVRDGSVTAKPYSSTSGFGLGARAWISDGLFIQPCPEWLGRVVNALGAPIDERGPIVQGPVRYALDREPPNPMAMTRIRIPRRTGVKAIDVFAPLCAGQRIGIFAGSGVGKSTLLSMITRNSEFSTIVVALVAERGREVREFIEDVLAPSRARAVTVVATSSESPMMRKLAAKTATTVAEFFRDRGESVLLVVDSLTRYAHALREIALAAGELPVARGYAPTVFADIPRLLERVGPGTANGGSITGIYSVLVDGDDHNEPVADTVRGILDGHIVLDRSIADQGRFPAVNPLSSISRLANVVWSAEDAELVRSVKSMVSRFEETRELRVLGAYKPGSDPELDQAVAITPKIYNWLAQAPDSRPTVAAIQDLRQLLAQSAAPQSVQNPRPSAEPR